MFRVPLPRLEPWANFGPMDVLSDAAARPHADSDGLSRTHAALWAHYGSRSRPSSSAVAERHPTSGLPPADAARTTALSDPDDDALLHTLAEQAQQLEALFHAFADRALGARNPNAAAAALTAAVKAQQASFRTLVAIAALQAQRRGRARLVLHDDDDDAFMQ